MSTITIIQGNNNDKDNTKAYMVKGEKGVSPTVSVERTTGGAIITTTDYEGTHTAQINDGVSPTVETSKTAGVTTITITDYEGTHTATIDDGETYEVPTGSVIGFDGTTIPAGYEEVEYDSGWLDLPLGTGITQYDVSSRYNCKYRKIGSAVYVIGCIKGISSDGTVFAQLPANFRPINAYTYVTGINTKKTSIIYLQENGVFEFIGRGSGDTVASTEPIFIQTNFLVD